jgi:hypothetical protein
LLRRWCPQPGDQREGFCEHLLRNHRFGHLERDVVAVADDLGPDLDQLLAQTGPRSRFRRFRYHQRAHKITAVVSERMKLKADGVDGEDAAW